MPVVRTAADRAVAVGAAACAACHRDKHEAWTSGRHSRMIQPAKAETALGDFSQSRLTLHGKPYRLRSADGALYITESSLTGKPVEHRVDYTLGNRRIQHYLTTIDRGRIVVLPPTWDVLRREWFDNVDIIRPDEQHANPVQQWNKNCVGCHVSQQDNHYAPATRTYATDVGGLRHVVRAVSWARAARTSRRSATAVAAAAHRRHHRPADAAATRPRAAWCARSAIRSATRWRPGSAPARTTTTTSCPSSNTRRARSRIPVYWADGRPRRFSNDAIGLWQSRCFLKGGAHVRHVPRRAPARRGSTSGAGADQQRLCTRVS